MFELDRSSASIKRGSLSSEGLEEHHVWVHWGVSREGAPGVQVPTTRGVGPAAWSPGFLADGELVETGRNALAQPTVAPGLNFLPTNTWRRFGGFFGRLAPSPPSAARRLQDAASRGF